MRESRLNSIITLLRAHRTVSASALARRFGVSVRTVQRDMEELGRRGVPVYAERGPRGGYSILTGYRPPAGDLTDAETLSLFLPGGDHPAGALGLAGDRRAAMTKLAAFLDDDRNRRATLLQERLLVVPEGWREPIPPPAALRTVFAAVTGNRIVDLDYAPVSGAPGNRRCQPLGVVVAGTFWYLLARKSGSGPPEGEHRTYRIDRIRSAHLTGEQFVRDPADDLAILWEQARTSFAGTRDVEVIVRTTRGNLRVVRQVMELACSQVGTDSGPGDSGPGDSGSDEYDGAQDDVVLLRGRAASVRAAAGFLAGLGAAAEVVHPPDVRSALATIAAENTGLYRRSRDENRVQ